MKLAAAVLLLGSAAHGRLLLDSTLGLSEVAWQPEGSQIFLGSPSLLRLPGGRLLASGDRFGSGFKTRRNASVWASDDNGTEWRLLTWVTDQYWSNLFQLPGDPHSVYLLGTDCDGPAAVKIARSPDGGRTWPVEQAAVLRGVRSGNDSYETGPTPLLLASDGRVYRAVERMRPPFAWGKDYEATCLHADARANLTDPGSWAWAAPLPFNRSWLPAEWKVDNPGYLEGNMVEGPDGAMYNLLRLNSRPTEGNYAVLLRLDGSGGAGGRFVFDSVVRLPGGHTKFVVRRDPVSGLYFTLSNPNTDPAYPDQRNVLALCASPDLRNWRRVLDLLSDDTGLSPPDSVKYTGFHYADWQIDGADIIYLVRTAYRGAVSYHNSNRITFKRLRDFRTLL